MTLENAKYMAEAALAQWIEYLNGKRQNQSRLPLCYL
jgi:hypothetical protein